MVAEIQRRYGDHLYAKHDYDSAVGQYAATIGFLEPSYVIRKFLDAQRIHNLTAYLEALHAKARPQPTASAFRSGLCMHKCVVCAILTTAGSCLCQHMLRWASRRRP